MKRQKIETVMTYEQWQRAYKRNLKKAIRNTLSTCFQWAILSVMFAGLPLGMLIHWIGVGY